MSLLRPSRVSFLRFMRAVIARRFRRSSPAGLSLVAGRSHGLFDCEQLEQRQLLYTVTIGPGDVNPATGLGTVQIQPFSYAVPYLFRTIPDAVDDEVVVEEFADEMDFWTMFNPAVPPSGTVFNESNIRISYVTNSAQAIRLVVGPDPGMNGADDLDLRVDLNTTDLVNFTFLRGSSGENLIPTLTRRVVLTINNGIDGDGLKTDAMTGTRLELLLDGNVVQTIAGPALAALGTPVVGGGIQYNVVRQAGFDAIRFRSAADAPDNATYSDSFIIDDITVFFPGGRFGEFMEERSAFAVGGVFTGPVGASITFLDLNGNAIIPTLATGISEGGDVALIDRNDDGVPDFNDGIGRIQITGTDLNSSLTLWGGTRELVEGTWQFAVAESIAGLMDEFEMFGMGYNLVAQQPGQPPVVLGLPSSGGSLIVGSPYTRPTGTPGGYLATPAFPPAQPSFVNANQGIFVTGSIGNLNVNALLFGSSQITGAATQVAIGTLMGNFRVEGDLGAMVIQGEAGLWQGENQSTADASARVFTSTRSQITVGRTAGEILIAGRSAADITVFGDINNPARAVRSGLDYVEREGVLGQNPAVQNPEQFTIETTIQTNSLAQQVAFGTTWFRNDTLQDAEFVGYNATTVRISGNLGGIDPVNGAPDVSDVFAFPADGTQDVVIQSQAFGGYLRVVDRQGRVLAAADFGGAGRGLLGNRTPGSIIRFRPDDAEIYYLVLNNAPGGVARTPYSVTISGMVPVTLGAVRTGLGLGGGATPPVISLNAGSMGSLRIGTDAYQSDGSLLDIGAIANTNQSAEALFEYRESTVSVAGDLYGATIGGNIRGASLLVGRNFGAMITGDALRFGQSVLTGDMINFELRVGGSISVLDVRGGVATDQIDNQTDSQMGNVNIRTGTSGGVGHIGQFLVGAYVGSGLSVQTSPGSTFDQFFIGNTNEGLGSDFPGQIRGSAPLIRVGAGSDVRFVDFAIIQNNSPDAFTQIGAGQSFTFVDDAGASVTIRLELPGGAPPAAFDPIANNVEVRFLPINGSQGVAIGRVTATLSFGARLRFTVNNPGVVSIGRIIANTDVGGSQILMDGAGQLDVLRIDVPAGRIDTIRNATVGGDIVSIDAFAVHNIVLTGGSLGRTQTSPVINSRILGKFLGVAPGRGGGGGAGGVGAPIGVLPQALNQGDGADWDGTSIEFPITPLDDGLWMTPFPLEAVGSPVDGWLNGVVVRAGDLLLVDVAGGIGDVIVESGDLINVRANSNGVTPFGDFDGIFGSIYAIAIDTIDVGDGLLGTGPGPFARAGIFADDDIRFVFGTRINGAVIRGVIAAANVTKAPRTSFGNEFPMMRNAVEGIDTVELRNGRFESAAIFSGNLDDFWRASRFRDVASAEGNVNVVRGVNANLFSSSISGLFINLITLTGNSAFDATQVNSQRSIGTINADVFRNTTAFGNVLEFVGNSILAVNNVGTITTNNLNAGDMSDLAVIIGGSLSGEIAARNIERSSFNINNQVQRIFANANYRGNTLVAGELISMQVNQNIRSSSISVAGPVRSITTPGEITLLDLNSFGPFGRIDLIRAGGQITGNMVSEGPIGTIQSTGGDIVANISTTDASDGNLTLLQAGRDLRVDLRIAGNADQLIAGRHIGQQGEPKSRAIDIRGNLRNVSAPNGQIYTDILVAQNITGSITNGRVSMRPGNDLVANASIIAFGRINNVTLRGDFNGSIISFSGGIGTVSITDGSLRPGNRIAAFDGNIDLIRIKGGDLIGDVYTEGNLLNLEVLNGDDGFKGQIGVTSFRRPGRQWKNDIRNELPPGTMKTAGVDGVTIQALGSINRIFVQQGSIWESKIIAGETIGDIIVGLQIRNDNLTKGRTGVIAAGTSIGSVRTGGFAGGLFILAGVRSLGDDLFPGGTGANADTIIAGSIGSVVVGRKAGNITIAAGVNPGLNGTYNNNDDRFAPGVSSIGSVTVGLQATAVIVNVAGSVGFVTPGITVNSARPQLRPTLVVLPSGVPAAPGVAFGFVTTSGQAGSFTYTGAGSVSWNASLNRITVSGAVNSLVVSANAGILSNFNVLSTDNASLTSLVVNAELRGNSNVFVDAALTNATFNGRVDSTGVIGTGGNANAFVFAQGLIDGDVEALALNTLQVTGDLGRTGSLTDAIVQVRSLGSLVVTGGVFAGIVSSDLDINSVQLTSSTQGAIRAGRNIGSMSVAGVFNQSRVSARNNLGPVNISGDANESAILAGVDLGTDGHFGGTGFAADVVSNGSIASVFVGGNFRQSDISAGVLRGPDGFLGTQDDLAADGRSSIGAVTIVGGQTGSAFNSQQYRIISTGTVGAVTVAGQAFTSLNNFRVTRIVSSPVPVQVLSSRPVEDGRVYNYEIVFNQPIDVSTIGPALNIAEVRSGGVLVGLAQGSDYTFRFNTATNTLTINFARSVTDRALPQAGGVPGPGLFRFVLDASVLRGLTQFSTLDGNRDGTAGDDFSVDDFVGDVGDKITAGNPMSLPGVSFYGAGDLDLFLDSNFASDNLPDANTRFTLRGVLGDHPNANSDTFRIGGDVDVYRISLRAGQILRMGAIQGIALSAQRGIFDSTGQLLAYNGPMGLQVLSATGVRALPAAGPSGVGDIVGNDEYLVLTTGTYYLAVGGNLEATDIADVNAVLNEPPTPGAIGSYAFDVEVFDDNNTGFAGDSASGNGQNLPVPPVPQDFAGPDGIPGTADDLQQIVFADFVFTWDKKDLANPRDDIIRGTNNAGVTITRIQGTDGVWNTAADRIVHTVDAAIGAPGSTGAPGEIQPDIDIYRLNGGLPLLPGTRIVATLRLTETGSNIGLPGAEVGAEAATTPLRNLASFLAGNAGLSQNVQFALFEVPSGAGLEGGRLVGSPSAFLPIGGQPQTSSSNGTFTYGYNSQGDFFVEFIVPGVQNSLAPAAATYALYVQGVVRSDYQLEVVTQGRRNLNIPVQNVLLETQGGIIDWLQAGEGVTTTLNPFRAAAAGFSGQIGGQDVDDYILNNLRTRLTAIFANAGIDIRTSYSPSTFEGQPFSTVFLAGNAEPNAFFNDGTFGASQHVDAFNTDLTDQGVVFIPSLAVLGNDPSQVGVDRFIDQLAGAVARRIGELVGLSFEANTAPSGSVPVQATNSVAVPPTGGGNYGFLNFDRALAGQGTGANTQVFFMGNQNSLGVISSFVRRL